MAAAPGGGSSGKKRENKSDFVECLKCSTLLLPKDRDKHQTPVADTGVCQTSLLAAAGGDLGLHNTDYDFIRPGAIFGTVRELQNKDEDLADLSMNLQRQLVFLHPSAMKVAQIAVNDYVVVTSARGRTWLRIAWPHVGASLTSACPLLPCRELTPASRLSVKRFAGRLLDAVRVEVMLVGRPECREIPSETEHLVFDALRRKYYGSAVRPGDEVDCNHYCEVYSFKVCLVTAGEDHLDEAFAAMHITPVGDADSIDLTTATYYRITHKTEFAIRAPSAVDLKAAESSEMPAETSVTFTVIGGLRRQKEALQAIAKMSPETLRRLATMGMPPPRRILITGPSGTGKTCLVQALAAELGVDILELTAQDLANGDRESANKLAKKVRGRLVLLDNIDTLAAGGKKDGKEAAPKVVTLLKNLPRQTLVVATTNRISSVDEIVRGMFDREVETTVPTADEREEILRLELTKVPHQLVDKQIIEINSILHGYTGANVKNLMREALFSRAAKAGELVLQIEDLREALKVVKPTVMREVVLDIPKVQWTDIGGMENVKRRLRQCVEWPLLHKDAFKRLGVKPPAGLLMYGPPGCSKTMIARALATESGLNFLAVKGPELFSKWVGDSERAVRELFRRARAAAPAVVFFDEIDAIATERRGSAGGGSGVGDRILAQLLTEIDGVEALEDVMLVAATNRPDIIDEALLRPGRLDSVVYVPLPDEATRREIIRISFNQRQVDTEVSVEHLVDRTRGYSGAEIVAVVQEAAMQALEESFDIATIGSRHFEQALEIVRPRITAESVEFYEQFHKTFNKRK